MLRRRTLLLMMVVIALVAVAGTVFAGGRPLAAELTGAAEVPGPGDPDGSGSAWITLNQGQGEVCFQLMVSDILLPATGAHIHVGTAADSGPVVVPLTPPDESGMASGCTTDVEGDLVKAIRQNPADYYVNVHNADYPAGAVRGQLVIPSHLD